MDFPLSVGPVYTVGAHSDLSVVGLTSCLSLGDVSSKQSPLLCRSWTLPVPSVDGPSIRASHMCLWLLLECLQNGSFPK